MKVFLKKHSLEQMLRLLFVSNCNIFMANLAGVWLYECALERNCFEMP